jgi:D-methionine transport system substrate-binding protein
MLKKRSLFIALLVVLIVLAVVLVTTLNPSKEKVFKIGASPVPHNEILEQVKDDFKKETGYELKIIIFTDYVQPNIALEQEDIDANFFQHIPYLESFNLKNGYTDLISAAKIHVEPMGLYLKKSLNELSPSDTVLLPNDSTNEGRALMLLENNGIITLKTENKLIATVKDIAENKYGINFLELEAPLLPRTFKEDSKIAGAVINTNYAIEAGLNPILDSTFIEGSDSAYANIIAVKKKNIDSKLLKSLISLLQSEKIKSFINSKYNGAVVPVF